MERPQYEQMYELEDSYWWFVGRRRLAAALIKKWTDLTRSTPILDVGCGTGGNLELLSQWGDAAGIDFNSIALNLARRRESKHLAQASALSLPFADGTFGLLTMFDVLYHRWVTGDHDALCECHRVLRPGGWLLLTVPALPRLWGKHDEAFYAKQRYTLEGLQREVREGGFTVRKISYTNGLLLPLLIATRSLARWFPSASDGNLPSLPSWLNRILIGVLDIEAMWLRRNAFPVGSSLICLAQKPV